jgi:hypothetical protein
MSRIAPYLVLTILVGGLVATALSPAAQAQQPPAPGLSALTITGPFLLTFDENGHATINLNGVTRPLTGVLAVDPAAPAGSPLALTYMLPETVVTGTVSFTEPGGGTSDYLRFTDAAGNLLGGAAGVGPRMIFYSDIETGDTAMADTGAPANIGAGNFLQCGVNPFCGGETGLETGANGFDYRPGGVNTPFPQNNEYVGISDVTTVPEPTSLSLLAGGLVVMGLFARRSVRKDILRILWFARGEADAVTRGSGKPNS